ncbi:MAG: hypothetical protein ACM3SW_14285 [Actinomycetota bacterium]
MKTAGRFGSAFAAIVLCVSGVLTGPVCHASDKTVDRKDVVRQARAAYYNLRSNGLIAFQASIVPNWDPMIKEQLKTATPETVQRATNALNSLHFAMSLDSANKVDVTHSADGPAANQQMAKAFDQIFGGMEQAVKGVFATWSPFMLTSVFPEVDSDYQVQELSQQYLVTYKDGDADVVLTMAKDFAVSEVKVTTKEFTSTVWPEFTPTAKGYVLSGYKAHYQSVAGNDTTELNIKLENREVSTLQLPDKMNIDAVYNGSPYQIELGFADYQVQKK